ncbi:MAG: hypothetical protein QOI71_3390 [Gaiellales bacterium]|nr:hypothetical protein [Gaiellales bacterium]
MPRHPITARVLLIMACAGATAYALAPAQAGAATPAHMLAAQADPGALTGTWKRVTTQADLDRTASFREEPSGWQAPLTGPYTLVIASGSFSVRDSTGFAVAQTTRIDSGGAFDVLAYRSPDVGAFCPQWIPQNASYTWGLDGADLVLTPVDDRCADRSSVLAGHWVRGSNVRVLLARETSVKERANGEIFTDRLTEGGAPAGQDRGVCTFVSKRVADCRITVTLADGVLVLRGRLGPSKALARLTIVGGTGAYRGTKGTATVRDQGQKKVLLTLHLV